MEMDVILQQLTGGFLRSLGIFVWTLVLSVPFGFVVCKGRMSKIKVVSVLVKIYIDIMRGTPLMLQLFAWYFAPPLIFGVQMPMQYRFIALVIGFTLNYAAYFAEIYRSGIQSMPIGQYEAAKILGYSKKQRFHKIILPQVIKRVLPAMTNEIITLVKDTSLAYAISYSELFAIAKQIAAAQTTVSVIFIAGVFYFVFNYIVSFVMGRIEKKLAYYH
ncbi:amino acid ABC transporter permease [Eubacterium oxidoreducens]|uniref:Polar amino acid transport system permease protein n=1 Tax=Eubacterium oxidoreducens TaxID=1732 RepID=A0A1G6AGX7_EUBOX|nr:amino acid ABC transporter permease [Eubacterium oxidoreducens]SDB07681.1 polar amino acid transport system permease protein [Eubacterium oxidoreducens]